MDNSRDINILDMCLEEINEELSSHDEVWWENNKQLYNKYILVKKILENKNKLLMDEYGLIE